jgi:hypothetical protein
VKPEARKGFPALKGKTMNIKCVPEKVLQQICASRFHRLEPVGSPTQAMLDELETLTAAELFEHYCSWHGLTGWSSKLASVWETLNGRPQAIQAITPDFRRDDLDFWLKVTGSELTIGAKVKVDQANAGASDWKSDWENLILVVAGIVLNPENGSADIHLADCKNVTDGFSVHDLLPAN